MEAELKFTKRYYLLLIFLTIIITGCSTEQKEAKPMASELSKGLRNFKISSYTFEAPSGTKSWLDGDDLIINFKENHFVYLFLLDVDEVASELNESDKERINEILNVNHLKGLDKTETRRLLVASRAVSGTIGIPQKVEIKKVDGMNSTLGFFSSKINRIGKVLTTEGQSVYICYSAPLQIDPTDEAIALQIIESINF